MALSREERLSLAHQHGLQTQERFEELLDELATIRVKKVIQYGEERYNLADTYMSKLLCLADIFGKWIRVKVQMLQATPGEPLRETLNDLAAFALMGIQVGEKEGWL